MGDLGSVPGLGRSPGEGKGYSRQYSGLENSMDWVVHGVAESQTRLSDFHFTYTHTPSHSEDLADQGATHRGMQRETTRAEEAAS